MVAHETVLSLERSKRKGKKYMARVLDRRSGATRVLHFGASGYEQYRDRTPLRAFAHADHGDRSRQRNYFKRHSGVGTRAEAIRLEWERTGGVYSPKLLSHIYLW